MLLDFGADPFAETDHGLSVLDAASKASYSVRKKLADILNEAVARMEEEEDGEAASKSPAIYFATTTATGPGGRLRQEKRTVSLAFWGPARLPCFLSRTRYWRNHRRIGGHRSDEQQLEVVYAHLPYSYL